MAPEEDAEETGAANFIVEVDTKICLESFPCQNDCKVNGASTLLSGVEILEYLTSSNYKCVNAEPLSKHEQSHFVRVY